MCKFVQEQAKQCQLASTSPRTVPFRAPPTHHEAAGGRRESSRPVLGEHRRASRDCDFRIFLISYLPLVHPAMSNLSADGADCEKPSRRTLGSSELPEPPTNLKKVLQAP